MNDPTAITETERPLPPGQPAHPRREVWRLMRTQELALQAEREAAAKERVRLQQLHVDFVVKVAIASYELRTFARRNEAALRAADLSPVAEMAAAIEGKFAAALRKADVDVVDPEGEEFTADMASWVDVLESVPAEGIERPTVGTVVKPAIRLEGEVVQRAVAPLLIPKANGAGLTEPAAPGREEPSEPAPTESPADRKDPST